MLLIIRDFLSRKMDNGILIRFTSHWIKKILQYWSVLSDRNRIFRATCFPYPSWTTYLSGNDLFVWSLLGKDRSFLRLEGPPRAVGLCATIQIVGSAIWKDPIKEKKKKEPLTITSTSALTYSHLYLDNTGRTYFPSHLWAIRLVILSFGQI